MSMMCQENCRPFAAHRRPKPFVIFHRFLWQRIREIVCLCWFCRESRVAIQDLKSDAFVLVRLSSIPKNEFTRQKICRLGLLYSRGSYTALDSCSVERALLID